MAIKKYAFIRVDRDALKSLNERLDRINNQDLKKIGVQNKKIHQIDMTKFLFKNRIYISDKELKMLAKKSFGGKIC